MRFAVDRFDNGTGTIVSPVSGTVAGTVGKVAKFTGATTVGNSQITDNGSTVTVANLDATMSNMALPYTDIGTLAAGNVDLDLSAVHTVGVKFAPNIAGTIIRSIKPAGNPANTGKGEVRILLNSGSSVLSGDSLAILAQDDGSGLYQHIHLEGRQPWHVIPVLGQIILRLDDDTGKWHSATPLAFGTQPRLITITPAAMANTNVDDYAPTDATTGTNGRWASWWRLSPQASTRLTGIEASAPTAGTNEGRRIMITNYGGASMVIAHANSGGGASVYPTYCPGSADYTLRFRASVWLTFDYGNSIWIVEGA